MLQLEQLSFKIQLREKISTLSGDSFQDFFSDFMGECFPNDFQKTCTWGKDGDRKNDGYLKSRRQLFQCYAPNELSQKKTLDKIEEDFTGALTYWSSHFDEWVFVHNCLRGTPAFISQKLLDLEKNYNPKRLTPWGFSELSKHFFSLPKERIIAVLGPPLTEDIFAEIGFAELEKVLRKIASETVPSDVTIQQPPPEKIKINCLSVEVSDILCVGMRKASLVENFFGQWHDPTFGDRTAFAFRQKYEELKQKNLSPDQIFHELLIFAGGALTKDAKMTAAVYSVLAYFFECCEIFESVPVVISA